MYGFVLGSYTTLRVSGYKITKYKKTQYISYKACQFLLVYTIDQSYSQKYSMRTFKALELYPE